MAKLLYPKHYDGRGPWLIDSFQLDELDTLINQVYEILSEYYRIELDKKIDEKLMYSNDMKREDAEKYILENYSRFNLKKDIKLVFKSEKILHADSFKEAKRELGIQNEVVKSFEIFIKAYDKSFEMKCGDDYYSHSSSNNYIQFKFPDVGIENAEEVQFKIENWLREIQAPLWQRIWLTKVTKFSVFMIIYIYFIFVLVYSLVNAEKNSGEEMLKSKAVEILNNGIDDNERNQALEILLRVNLKLYPTDVDLQKKVISNIYILIAVIIIIVSIILLNKPNIHIGIGKGDNYIKRWRLWIKFFSYALPLFLITSLFGSWLYEYFKNIN